jgi:hypothetical protein
VAFSHKHRKELMGASEKDEEKQGIEKKTRWCEEDKSGAEETGDEIDPNYDVFDDDDNEFDDEAVITVKDIKRSYLFAIDKHVSDELKVNQVKKILLKFSENINMSIGIENSFNQLSKVERSSMNEDKIGEIIKSERTSEMNFKLTIEILKMHSGLFESQDMKFKNRIQSSESFEASVEHLKSVKGKSGKFLSTGFKTGDVGSSLNHPIALSFKINIRDKKICKAISLAAGLLNSMEEEDFEDYEDKQKETLVRLKNSMKVISDNTDVEFTEEKVKFSRRSLKKSLRDIGLNLISDSL